MPHLPGAPPPRPAADRVPALAALATALVGAINVASALTPELPARLDTLLSLAPVAEVELAQTLALPAGVGLLAAAWLLFRRRRRALQTAVTLLAVAGAIDLLKGLDVEEALLSWAAAFGLWHWRAAFHVQHDEPPRFVGAALLLIGLGAAAAAPEHASMALLAVAAFAPLFSPRALRHVVHPGERLRAAVLVRAHGGDTLSAFKLRGDLHRRFSGDGRAFAGYRVIGRTLLLAGDPVGPAGAAVALLGETAAHARRHGLAVGVVSATAELADAARAAGFYRLYLGDEAIVATGELDLSGSASKTLRKAVRRVERHGYESALARVCDLSPAVLAELEAVSARWRDGAPERGFAMAHDRLHDELLPDALVVLARDEQDAVRGFLHFVPVFGRPAVSLGFMRRDRDTPNGLTEFLVVHAARRLGDAGYDEFSLNFATFGRWLRDPANALERTLARGLRVADRWFQIERLHRFNARFAPRWQPRYLLFTHPTALPRVGLATLRAEGWI